jgi:ParB-like chromosome segregation protein Spo0J
MSNDPIDNIEWREASTLQANYWNPNRVHKPELKLLEHSLLSTGWIQPILINKNGMVIDGFHRWRLSQDSEAVKARYGGKLPVAVLPIENDEAMAITVRINRAKGSHVAIEMHKLVNALITDFGWSRERVAQEIGAHVSEVDLLMQEGVFTNKDIKNWSYSKAWYPAEGKFDPKDELPVID